MSKLPYFPCYARDVISSNKIAAMSGDAFKAYWMLLCASWLEDERATLPNPEANPQANSQANIAALARVSLDVWLTVKDEVLACFKETSTGRLYNERLMEISSLLDKRSKAGSKGGSKTQAKRQAKRVANTQASESESESESDIEAEAEIKTEIEKKKEEDPLNDYERKVSTYFNSKINGSMIHAWREAHQTIDIQAEISKAKAWLFANQHKKKIRFGSFLNNWMTNAANPPAWMKVEEEPDPNYFHENLSEEEQEQRRIFYEEQQQ